MLQLAALLLLCTALIDAKPRGLGPAGRDYILSVLPQADKIGTLSESTIEVPATTDGSTLAQQVRALDAQAARRIQERDAQQAARKARETQRAVARTFNALSEEPVLAELLSQFGPLNGGVRLLRGGSRHRPNVFSVCLLVSRGKAAVGWST